MKKLLALLLALVMVFALVACGGNGDTDVDPTPDVSVDPNAGTLDDVQGAGDDTGVVYSELSMDSQGNVNPLAMRSSGIESYSLYEMLYASSNGIGSEMEPWLADATKGGNNELGLKGMDHEVGSGIYTFYIYDYITDSAGNKITAEDVVYSFEQTLAYGQASGWGAIEKWEAVNDTTINMVCSGDLDTKGEIENILLRCFIFDKGAYESSSSQFMSDACGTGRYKLTAFTQDVSATLELRDDYWQTNEDLIPRIASGNIKKIVTQVISDNNTKAVAIQSGDLDVIGSIAVGNIASLTNDDKYEIFTFPQNGIHYLEPNCSEDSIMNDVNMRLAVFYAIDNANLCSVLNAATGSSITSYYPLTAFGHSLFGDYPASWDNQTNYVTESSKDKVAEYLQKANYQGEEIKLLNLNDTTGMVEQIINWLTDAGMTVKNCGFDRNAAAAEYANSTAWDLYFNSTNSSDYVTNLFDHAFNNGGEGATKNFIEDETLNALMKKAYAVGATDADVEALWQHCVDNAYMCPLVRSTNAVVLPANTISTVWLADKNNLILGACYYEAE